MIKICFDFDGTLSDRLDVQKLASELSATEDVELWIITRRYEKGFEDKEVKEAAKKFGIKNIVFTNREYKSRFLEENGIDIHIDDDPFEAAFQPLGSLHRIVCIADPIWEDTFMKRLEVLRKESQVNGVFILPQKNKWKLIDLGLSENKDFDFNGVKDAANEITIKWEVSEEPKNPLK